MPTGSPTESSEESDVDVPDDGQEHRDTGNRGIPTQAGPLDVRFSQKKMRHMFWNGNLLEDVAPLVQTIRCTPDEEARFGARWRLDAPFPPIEVVRWRCKLRDERTGRPKVDQQTGMILYDSEEHLFTLDNRRLYCLQLAATRVWPDSCTIEVKELPAGPPELMREMKKFKTVDCGKSILIGSRQDKVPFIRWSWRAKLKVADDSAARNDSGYDQQKGKAKASSSTKAKAKASRKPGRDVVTIPQPLVDSQAANAGSLLLQLVKDGASAPDESADGAAKGALLLGLLKGGSPPTKDADPSSASPAWNWLESDNGSNWWQSGDSWQASCDPAPKNKSKGRRWVERKQ